MGRMSGMYFVALLTTALCSGCPTREASQRPSTTVKAKPVATVQAPIEEPAPAVETIEALPEAPLEVALEPEPEPEPEGLRLCVVPAALEVDPTLLDIADAVSVYWTEQGLPVVHSTAELGCEVLLDVGETALGKDGWNFKDAQTWIPRTMSATNPAITRFRLEFWLDPVSSQELRAALAAHEIGHVLGFDHIETEDSATGELMSPIVTEEVAQELFAGRL
jgi:hypothetical protein